MKKTIGLISLPFVLILSSGYANAAGNDCNARRLAVESQIEQAKLHNNNHKVYGLEKALADINAYCTDEKLIQDAEEKVAKLTHKVNEKQSDLAEVQLDLNNATAKNDGKKVAKYKEKLADKQNDIDKARAELNEASAELAALKG